jgi:hypothetical protein
MSNDKIIKPGYYYDLGHGINKAEALRQDITFHIAHIKINYPGEPLADELDELFERVDALAVLAGATVYESAEAGQS